MEERRVAVTFTGGVAACLGYLLLLFVLSVFVVPTAWGMVAVLVWWCESMTFADGTQARFTGRAGAVWPLFAVAVFLMLLPQLATAGLHDVARRPAIQALLILLLVPLDAAVKLPLCRWIVESIRLEPGGTARFTAGYGAFLCWTLLVTVSAFTVVLGPFAAVAMARWLCRNIEGDGFGVEFVGSGWGLLGASLLWTCGIVLIVPIPWVLRAMLRWWTNRFRLLRREAFQTVPA